MTNKQKTLIKSAVSVAVIAAIVVGLYFLFKALGITDLTKEELQEFIAGTGAIAPLVFLVATFLQATFVPIPGMVTILAGNYLFGAWLSFLYSYIGMLLGSLVAYALGRKLGRPFVNWLAGGKEEADGWIARLKGRENVFLFLAFFLPLFPDDLLCAVAGILPMRFPTF